MINIIVIGASAGGIHALQTVFKNIPQPLRVPIIVVLHLNKDTQMPLPLIFGQHAKGALYEAGDKTELIAGCFYFAPPDYHLLFEDQHTLALTQDAPVHYSRPSIDVTFESAAQTFGAEACGVLLTGASADGAQGLKYIKESGGCAIVQDPGEADAPTMPLAAVQMFQPDAVLSLVDIAKALSECGGVQ